MISCYLILFLTVSDQRQSVASNDYRNIGFEVNKRLWNNIVILVNEMDALMCSSMID